MIELIIALVLYDTSYAPVVLIPTIFLLFFSSVVRERCACGISNCHDVEVMISPICGAYKIIRWHRHKRQLCLPRLVGKI